MKREEISPDKESGFTLTELMVSLVVAGIFSLGVMQLFISISTLYSAQDAVRQGQQDMRVVLDTITDDFRSLQVNDMEMQFNDEFIDLDERGMYIEFNSGTDSTDVIHLFNQARVYRPNDVVPELRSRRVMPLQDDGSGPYEVRETNPTPEFPNCPGDCAPGGTYNTCDQGTADVFGDLMTTSTSNIIVQPDHITDLNDYMAEQGIVLPILATIIGPKTDEGLDHSSVTGVKISGPMSTTPEIFAITNVSGNAIEHVALAPWNPSTGLTKRYGFYGIPPGGGICGSMAELPDGDQGDIPVWGTSDIVIVPIKYVCWKIIYDSSVNQNRLVRANNIDEDVTAEIIADNITDFQIRPFLPDGVVVNSQEQLSQARFFSILIKMEIPSRRDPGEFITVADSTMFYR